MGRKPIKRGKIMAVKLCVPTTFEDVFLDKLNQLNEKYRGLNAQVYEIYGSFKLSIFGTGWPSTLLPEVDAERLERHILKAHQYGIKFAYTLNPICMNLLEYTDKGRKALDKLLNKLAKTKVDTVVVAIPYLIEYIARNYPEFEVKVSSLSYIDSLNRALMYEELGASRLTLSEDVNRCFHLLRLIRKNVKAGLEVIANNGCLLKCPFRTYHNTITAHVSQSVIEDQVGFTYKPYPLMRCVLKRLCDHKEIIKAPWFRPEDIKYYHDVGVEYIKIAGRGLPAEDLLRLVEAYLSRRYDGDIYALIDNSYMHFCWDMFHINAEILPPLKISIDNRSLDGWYEYFVNKNPPCLIGCGDCNYCDEIAKKVVKSDPEIERKYIERIKRMVSELASLKPPLKIEERTNGRMIIRD